MKTLYFMWLIILPLYAESSRGEEILNINKTIRDLHKLGPKACTREVEKSTFDISSSLPKKGPEVIPALKIALTHIFEIFKKKGHGHWKSRVLADLRGRLHRLHQQTKSYENSMPVVSSELETLVRNFKKLEQFLTRENFTRCAWEIARNEILGVMDHFQKIFGGRNVIL